MSKQILVTIYLALVFFGMLCQSTNVKVIEANSIIEAGDFIKYEVTITPIFEGVVTPTGVNFEFINIEGTNATISSTIHLSDGDEWDSTTTFDIVSGSSTGFIIPSNPKIGDSIPIDGYGNLSIEGETTSIHTGVNRTTVFARYSNSTDSIIYFWDKPTGIMLEQNSTKFESTMFWKIIDTNIWQTQLNDSSPYQNIIYIVIVLVAILSLALYLRIRKKRPKRRR
jgi:hypothetical protein